MTSPRVERPGHLNQLLELVHRHGAVTRAEMGAKTGLSRSAVKSIVAELAERRLVVESNGKAPAGAAERERGSGRPSYVVTPRIDGTVVLAVDIRADTLAVAVVALGGHVHLTERIHRRSGRFWAKDTVEDLTTLASTALAHCKELDLHVAAVGVAFTGLVRASDGYVYVAPNMGWRDVPLAGMLAERLELDIPVLVANDGDATALGEHFHTPEPRVRTLLSISTDIGIAGGITIDGRPWGGAAASGMEAGHIVINPGGRPCRCGAQGCWETEVGPLALLRHAGREATSDRVSAVRELLTAADRGDPDILRALAIHGRWLGLGLATLTNLFAPERIVLGGLFAQTFRYEGEFVTRELQARVLAPLREQLVVMPSQLASDASLLGAAELALSQVIAQVPATGEGR